MTCFWKYHAMRLTRVSRSWSPSKSTSTSWQYLDDPKGVDYLGLTSKRALKEIQVEIHKYLNNLEPSAVPTTAMPSKKKLSFAPCWFTPDCQWIMSCLKSDTPWARLHRNLKMDGVLLMFENWTHWSGRLKMASTVVTFRQGCLEEVVFATIFDTSCAKARKGRSQGGVWAMITTQSVKKGASISPWSSSTALSSTEDEKYADGRISSFCKFIWSPTFRIQTWSIWWWSRIWLRTWWCNEVISHDLTKEMSRTEVLKSYLEGGEYALHQTVKLSVLAVWKMIVRVAGVNAGECYGGRDSGKEICGLHIHVANSSSMKTCQPSSMESAWTQQKESTTSPRIAFLNRSRSHAKVRCSDGLFHSAVRRLGDNYADARGWDILLDHVGQFQTSAQSSRSFCVSTSTLTFDRAADTAASSKPRQILPSLCLLRNFIRWHCVVLLEMKPPHYNLNWMCCALSSTSVLRGRTHVSTQMYRPLMSADDSWRWSKNAATRHDSTWAHSSDSSLSTVSVCGKWLYRTSEINNGTAPRSDWKKIVESLMIDEYSVDWRLLTSFTVCHFSICFFDLEDTRDVPNETITSMSESRMTSDAVATGNIELLRPSENQP